MRAFVVGASVAALIAATETAAAQTTVGWDAAVFSSYVWRGLTLSSKPVVQPDLYLTIPLGKASLTAGGWANIELGKYDAPDIGEGGGRSSLDLTEFDWWGEVGIPAGVATITAGATGYIYPNDFGFTSDVNTLEIYGKVGLDVPLNPKLSAYYDVKAVKGLYLEGSVSHGIPIGPQTLTFGALAGFSSNETPDPDDDSFNFSDDGLTHVDLSASMGFTAGPLSITPAVHFVIANDDFTKFTKLNKQHDAKIWGGVTISWSKAFGGKAEE